MTHSAVNNRVIFLYKLFTYLPIETDASRFMNVTRREAAMQAALEGRCLYYIVVI